MADDATATGKEQVNNYSLDIKEDNDCQTIKEDEEQDSITFKQTNTPENAKTDGIPVDRGWAWAILSGCVLFTLIHSGLARSYGVLFLQFQERFKATAAAVALMSMIQNIVVCVSGLLIMTVGMKKLSARTIIAIGAALQVIGHIGTGLATDIRVFYFTHAMFVGTGMAMSYPPMLVMIGIYFSKHRGLANSIFAGSAPIGGFILGPVVVKLFEEYGYTGTLIIIAGVFCNFFVSASLMRPPFWYTKRYKKKKEILADDASKLLVVNSECMHSGKTNSNAILNHKNQHLQLWKKDQEMKGLDESDLLQRATSYKLGMQSSPDLISTRSCSQLHKKDGTVLHLTNTTSRSQSRLDRVLNILDKSESALCVSAESLHGSFINLQNPDKEENAARKGNSSNDDYTCGVSFKAGVIDILATVFDCKLLKNIVFIQFLAMAFVTVSGMTMVPVYILTYAKDSGISYDRIGVILAVMACVDLFSKLTTGVMADRKLVRRTTILGVAALGTGTFCHLARFYITFPLTLAMYATFACCFGLYYSMYATILIDCIGLTKLQSSLGFVTLVHGVSTAIFFPICGLLRDVSGSYIYTLHLCGCLCYIGALLLFLLPFTHKKLNAKQTTEKKWPESHSDNFLP